MTARPINPKSLLLIIVVRSSRGHGFRRRGDSVQPLVAFSPSISHIRRVNLPNAITLSRLFLTAGFIIFVAWESTWGHFVALALFIVAAASDFLDGYLARKLNLVTPLGKLLDPLADKILVCSAFVFLTAKGPVPGMDHRADHRAGVSRDRTAPDRCRSRAGARRGQSGKMENRLSSSPT